MKRLLALCVLALVTGCAPAVRQSSSPVDGDAPETGFPGLPADAARVADRLVACTHFSGEFNGDGSDRDKEVTATMTAMRCDLIERDVAAIREKYAGNKAVQDALAAASQW